MARPSVEQARVLAKLLASPTARLIRWPGGFWVTKDTKVARPATTWTAAVPEWHTGTRTMRAMEDRGWLCRDPQDAPEWAADRVLTVDGRCLAESLAERRI